MRIFVFRGRSDRLSSRAIAGAARTTVWCGDRDPEARAALPGQEKHHPCNQVNARNLRGTVKAARGLPAHRHASASVFNEIVLRAALRLRAHYVDLSSHLKRHPFKAEHSATQRNSKKKAAWR